MERRDYILEELKKYGIHSLEELNKSTIKPLNISLMVSKPVSTGSVKKDAAG